MGKNNKYIAHQPDHQGFVQYTDEENETWSILYNRQIELIKGRACDEYIQGVADLGLSADHIPQLPHVNEVLLDKTGWQVAPVAALISFEEFFQLLANRKFPAATFIRRREELDYLQEPDIFHEIFGHCPLLTDPSYAEFSQTYGKLGLSASKEERVFLARLYWFTIEFGLMQTQQGMRIYGGGILSSKEETVYSLESDQPERHPLEVLDVLRTPYRIDVLQRIYYVINDLSDLHRLTEMDLMGLVTTARKMGMLPSLYPPKNEVA